MWFRARIYAESKPCRDVLNPVWTAQARADRMFTVFENTPILDQIYVCFVYSFRDMLKVRERF
jgi:hypothetical protein